MNAPTTHRATRLAWVLAFVMIVVALGSWAMRPPYHTEPYHKQLDALIPKDFGDWHMISETMLQIDPTVTADDGTTDLGRLYDEVLMRTYANSKGEVIQLAILYGRNQRQELKIHRPELCYIAQGFKIVQHTPTVFPIRDMRGQFIPGARMLAVAPERTDAVSYWIRIGESYSLNPWAIRFSLFKRGLMRNVDDGILVRLSETIVDSDEQNVYAAYRAQADFIGAMRQALSPGAALLLAT